MADTATKPRLSMVGEDGNANAIIGRANRALRRAGRAADIPEFNAEATSGDYDHVIQTVLKWFDVDAPDEMDETEKRFAYGDR